MEYFHLEKLSSNSKLAFFSSLSLSVLRKSAMIFKQMQIILKVCPQSKDKSICEINDILILVEKCSKMCKHLNQQTNSQLITTKHN